jgi:PBP1b-binding outer membrane lipoprotein LpoB
MMFRVVVAIALALLLSSCAGAPEQQAGAPEQQAGAPNGCFQIERSVNKSPRAMVPVRCPAGLHGLLGPV